MTTTLAPASPNPDQQAASRLRPLRLAMFVSGIAPWVPVEKVFMTQLGFTPALVATMAAAYAAVVPVLEIPSGILADRWSRRGVLMLASGAALLSVLVGALILLGSLNWQMSKKQKANSKQKTENRKEQKMFRVTKKMSKSSWRISM